MWRRMLLAGLVASGVAISVLSFEPASAADPSGTAIAVLQSTSATGPEGKRNLASQTPVYSGDRVDTDSAGQAQILFADETRLVVGPNSSLLIDKFVYNAQRNAAQVSINAIKGALRFISGKSPSQAYKISTPSALIGVRGTMFDVAIGQRGETGLLLFQGSVRLCGVTRRCITVDQSCEAALALTNGAVGRLTAQANRAARLQARFPLVGDQGSLRPDFRANVETCGFGSSPGPASSDRIGGEGGGGGGGGNR